MHGKHSTLVKLVLPLSLSFCHPSWKNSCSVVVAVGTAADAVTGKGKRGRDYDRNVCVGRRATLIIIIIIILQVCRASPASLNACLSVPLLSLSLSLPHYMCMCRGSHSHRHGMHVRVTCCHHCCAHVPVTQSDVNDKTTQKQKKQQCCCQA